MTWLALIGAIARLLALIWPWIEPYLKKAEVKMGHCPSDPHLALTKLFDAAYAETWPIYHMRTRYRLTLAKWIALRHAPELKAAAMGGPDPTLSAEEFFQMDEVA